jgi:diguanylate cyclase (GGDEF)-like protein/PAS domain S-box-containing protein
MLMRSPKHLLLGALAVAAGGLVLVHLRFPGGAVGEAAYLAVILGAGVAALWGAVRRPRETRAAWCWIATGVALSALADLTWSIYVHVQGVEPDVSVADVPWLASYLAIGVGLLMLLRIKKRNDIDGLIDMAVVAVVALLVVWEVTLQATVTDASVEPGVRFVWAAYPVLDAVLLALVIRLATSRTAGGLLLVAGVGSWLFSDFFYLLFPNSTSWARWLDAGWMIGAAMMAAAVWRTAVEPFDAKRTEKEISSWRVALAIAPLLIPGLIEIIGYGRGNDPNPVPLFVGSVVLAGLALLRSMRLLRTSINAQLDLRAAEQHFRALVQRSSDAALVIDGGGEVRYVSPAAQEQFGYSVEDLVGQVGWDLIHPDDLPAAVELFGAVGPGAHAAMELRVRDASGEWRWVEEVITNLVDDPGVAGIVANIRDISTRKAAEQELSRMAHYDNLTGLPNRWLLSQILERSLTADAPSVAVLVIDLDQFKVINDSRGHAVGDELLRAVADLLRSALPSGDTLGRIGGDEFAVICPGVRHEGDALERAAAIHEAIGGLVEVPGVGSFFTTMSVGIAIARDAETPDQLMQQADTAMYAAKLAGPARSVVFDQHFRNEAEERLTVLADLRSALRSEGLVVHYQPVVDLRDGTIEGVEALVRWRHPTRGLLLPGAFIPIAEQSDVIDHIGQYVLEHACADAAWWARAGTPLSVAVNISATQLSNERIADNIQTALYNSGLAAQLLVIEITETALLLGTERVMRNIAEIQALGVRVALDDFGTGYSSLSYLKQVPADIIKIDRSFIINIATDQLDRDIAASIIDLANAMGRTVIAEGVETQEQLLALQRLGCHLAQGFLWSTAVPSERILELQRDVGFRISAVHDLDKVAPDASALPVGSARRIFAAEP